jgi:hypothetical protein
MIFQIMQTDVRANAAPGQLKVVFTWMIFARAIQKSKTKLSLDSSKDVTEFKRQRKEECKIVAHQSELDNEC